MNNINAMETSLTLSIGGLPPLSARGCTQELKPKPQGSFKRTLNGDLIFVGSQEHKYISTIKCNDSIPLATEGLQIGTLVFVGCIQPLCQKVSISEESSKTVILERDALPDSVQIFDAENREIADFSVEGRAVNIHPLKLLSNPSESEIKCESSDLSDLFPPPQNQEFWKGAKRSYERNLFISYYPRLIMRVTSFVLTTDEWNMKSGWQLELEEV